jgi:hypothetical protein
MTKVQIALKFGSLGYAAKPYWASLNTLINISKLVHPKLGDAKKAAALLAACEKNGITPEQYKALVEDAARPFHTMDNSRAGEIIIPVRIFHSFLNHASMQAPKAIPRIQEKGLTFIAVSLVQDFLRTGQTEDNAKLFARFVKNQESNQRMWAEDKYIADFTAKGVLEVDEEIISAEDLRKLAAWGGKMVGIGACRPQGYGRFQVSDWTVPKSKP